MKRLIPFLFLTGAFLFFVSCNSDSDTSIDGTWNASELAVMYEGGGFAEASLPDSWSETLVLNRDGSYSYSWSKDGRSGSGSGTWEQKDEQLVLTEDGQTEEITAEISGDSLILDSTVPGGTAELSFGKLD